MPPSQRQIQVCSGYVLIPIATLVCDRRNNWTMLQYTTKSVLRMVPTTHQNNGSTTMSLKPRLVHHLEHGVLAVHNITMEPAMLLYKEKSSGNRRQLTMKQCEMTKTMCSTLILMKMKQAQKMLWKSFYVAKVHLDCVVCKLRTCSCNKR